MRHKAFAKESAHGHGSISIASRTEKHMPRRQSKYVKSVLRPGVSDEHNHVGYVMVEGKVQRPLTPASFPHLDMRAKHLGR